MVNSLRSFVASILRWMLLLIDPVPSWTELINRQTPASPGPSAIKGVARREEPAAGQAGRLRVYRRRTFAQEQAHWEWEHNKKAQEADRRAKLGFF